MTDVRCPCCGAPIDSAPLSAVMAEVTPVMAEVLTVLKRNPWEYTSGEDLARWVYRNDPNGGPVLAEKSISVVVHVNRPRLKALGWTINGRQGRGGGYRLVPFSPKDDA